ncbi:2628_t:CDS:1, partial [Cetraspora pellucida]
KVELHLQILPVKKQLLKANTAKSNSLILRMKTLSNPLATIYNSTSSQTTNLQDKNKDSFTLVFSKQKPKNWQKATVLQENSDSLKNSYEIRRSPY